MSYDWTWSVVPRALPALLKGLQLTLLITVAVVALGFLLAIFAAAGRLARSPFINKPVAAYIEFFRGTPALVQLVWVYYCLPIVLGLGLPERGVDHPGADAQRRGVLCQVNPRRNPGSPARPVGVGRHPRAVVRGQDAVRHPAAGIPDHHPDRRMPPAARPPMSPRTLPKCAPTPLLDSFRRKIEDQPVGFVVSEGGSRTTMMGTNKVTAELIRPAKRRRPLQSHHHRLQPITLLAPPHAKRTPTKPSANRKPRTKARTRSPTPRTKQGVGILEPDLASILATTPRNPLPRLRTGRRYRHAPSQRRRSQIRARRRRRPLGPHHQARSQNRTIDRIRLLRSPRPPVTLGEFEIARQRWKHSEDAYASRHSGKIRSKSLSILSGLTIGPNRRTTFPSRSIRNFVKFHLIAFVHKNPRRALFRYL